MCEEEVCVCEEETIYSEFCIKYDILYIIYEIYILCILSYMLYVMNYEWCQWLTFFEIFGILKKHFGCDCVCVGGGRGVCEEEVGVCVWRDCKLCSRYYFVHTRRGVWRRSVCVCVKKGLYIMYWILFCTYYVWQITYHLTYFTYIIWCVLSDAASG